MGAYSSQKTGQDKEIKQPLTGIALQHQCPLWVKSGSERFLHECPLYARKRTFSSTVELSSVEQGLRHGEADGLGGLEIDDELKFCRLLDRQVGPTLFK
jgi:hypothetical protein